ncbi:MAG: hypothetical protein U1E76_28745, partial [Planctomycetota bacterium]
MWQGKMSSVAVLVAMSGSAVLADAKAPRVAWERSLDGALSRAREDSKPVIIALSRDHDAECDDLADFVYPSLTFVKSSQRVICVVACPSQHHEVKDEGTGELVCARFRGIRCADHIAAAEAVRRQFLQDLDDFTPRHLLVLKDGALVGMRDGFLDEHALKKLIAAAVDASRCPARAATMEQQYVLEVLTWTLTGSRGERMDGVVELAYLLCGWSRDVAITVVRARAPAALRQRLARQLVEHGARSEPALLALAADPV